MKLSISRSTEGRSVERIPPARHRSLPASNSFAYPKGQIPLRYLVANRFEAGRRPAAIRNLAYHLARAAGLQPASNLSATR